MTSNVDAEARAATLRRALEQHRSAVSRWYDEVVDQVSERAERSGSLGKADIGALVVWKRLNANTPWAGELMATPEDEVRSATGAAYTAARDEKVPTPEAASAARRALSDLPGFKTGDALASAVIYAAARHRMAVYDRRAHAGLTTLGLELSNAAGRYRNYMAFIEQLRTEAGQYGHEMAAREVDLALYTLGGPHDRT